MVSELLLEKMIETENSLLESKKRESPESEEIEIDLDDDVLMNEIGFEDPAAEIDFKKLGEILTLNGGSIIVNTENYQLRLNKNSVSTDIKVFFANAGIEIIGPEASFKEKADLVKSFLHTITSLQTEQYNTKVAEEESDVAYS